MSQRYFFRILKIAITLATLAFAGCIDRITGYEISVFPLYVVPIGFAVWLFGVRTGVVMAIAATIVWFWADVAAGHVYSRHWIPYVNAAARLIFFLMTALAAHFAMRLLNRRVTRYAGPVGSLPVCTDCGKIRDEDGYWWHAQAWLRESSGRSLTNKFCPDCARKTYAGDTPTAGLSQ